MTEQTKRKGRERHPGVRVGIPLWDGWEDRRC